MRLASSKALVACLAVLAVAALSACGGSSDNSSGEASGTSGSARKVDIYSSLPLRGPSSAEAIPLENGIRLALAQADDKAGPFTVTYTTLDDSTGVGGWDATQTAANAHEAAADPRAVYYIGEFDDDASEVSMPILNQAGIAQVSPTNTYVGLTTNEPGSVTGEPGRYYPSDTRTYLRIVPIDSVQTAADLTAMHQAGCARVALVSDDEAYGMGMAKLLELQKGYYGVDVVSDTGFNPSAPSFGSYAATLKRLHVDCFLLAGVASKGGVVLTKDVHAALPKAKIFGPQDMCTSAWTNPQGRRGAGRDRPADRVHRGDPEPDRVPRREGVPGRLPGSLSRVESELVRDPRLRGDEARSEHDRRPRRQRRQQVGGAERAVRHVQPPFGTRDLQLREERRCDAQGDRAVQGRHEREPDVSEDNHAGAGVVGEGRWRGARAGRRGGASWRERAPGASGGAPAGAGRARVAFDAQQPLVGGLEQRRGSRPVVREHRGAGARPEHVQPGGDARHRRLDPPR